MLIKITLGGALTKFLSQDATGNSMEFTCKDGVSIAYVLEQLGVAADRPLMAILNGDLVQPQDYAHANLADGDSLSLVPPIQAG